MEVREKRESKLKNENPPQNKNARLLPLIPLILLLLVPKKKVRPLPQAGLQVRRPCKNSTEAERILGWYVLSLSMPSVTVSR